MKFSLLKPTSGNGMACLCYTKFKCHKCVQQCQQQPQFPLSLNNVVPQLCSCFRLLCEIDDVLGDRIEVTGDDLDKMKYTEKV